MRERSGGKRTDRCFKIYIDLPADVAEETVMRMIELAVIERIDRAKSCTTYNPDWAKLNADSVSVERRTPPYGLEAP